MAKVTITGCMIQKDFENCFKILSFFRGISYTICIYFLPGELGEKPRRMWYTTRDAENAPCQKAWRVAVAYPRNFKSPSMSRTREKVRDETGEVDRDQITEDLIYHITDF